MEKPKYHPWHDRFPDRFAQECAQMQARGFSLNETALREGGRVEFAGRSREDPARPLVVQYPDAFPSMPPRVFNSGDQPLLRRHHRADSGEICLFGPGQNRWSASLSGTAAVEEAEAIIREFHPSATPLPDDRVPEPVSALYRYEQGAIVAPPPISERIIPTDQVVSGTFRLRFARLEGTFLRGVVLEARTGTGAVTASEPFRSWYRRGQEENGQLVLVPDPPPLMGNPSQELRPWLRQLGVTAQRWVALVFPEQSGDALERRVSWLVARLSDRIASLYRTFPIRAEERNARVPGATHLASKRVVVIGCGAIGSKVAAALAAAGVGRFGLVDSDHFEPDNAVRHELSVDPYVVGVPKVFGLHDRLISINPQAYGNVECLPMHVGGIYSAGEEARLFDLLASADLVVEATGVHGVSRFVNDICHDLGTPSLYASVTNGAWGGEVVRIIPGQTACWLCWFEQYEHERPQAAPAPDVGVFAPGCDQPTFVGSGYEVGMLASLATWISVEVLLRAMPGRKDMPGDYLRWQARDPSGAPHVALEVLPVHRRSNCPLCNTA